ncbi:hypothetical protein F5883DRAFT_707938 [Diaporthe sp. PMI_573]|nr:hypothetical protein F5883DRAFT_707938 [Diaporthaceae sp. PMI_573]
MFSSRALAAIVAFACATLAAPKLEIKSVAGVNNTCWLGDIGEPCYSHGTGCSRTGAKASFYHLWVLLICAEPDTGIDEMIFYDACYPPDVQARNVAGRGTCRCLPGGDSDCGLQKH